MEKKRVGPINSTQKEVMIEFIKANGKLQTGKFDNTFTKADAQKLWENVSSMLNAVPGGGSKDWKQWRKTWQDLKKNTKSKSCQEKKYTSGTGGGSPIKILTKEDTEILEMLSPMVVEGHPTIGESITDFQFEGTNEAYDGLTANEVEVPMSSTSKEHNLMTIDKENEHSYTLQHVPDRRTGNKTFQKVTKTRRLENSLKISQQLVNCEEEKKDMSKEYYSKKISFMESRKQYQKDKLQALQSQNVLLKGIVGELKKILEKQEK